MKAARLLVFGLLLLVVSLPAGAVFSQSASPYQPASLQMAVVPGILPANGHTYPALVISLLDGSGSPTLSLADVTVYLSTNSTVADVPNTVTIPAGSAFVQVSVTTTSVSGTTTINGVSPGLTSGSVAMSTAKPVAGAASLKLFAAPSRSIQALRGDDGVYALQLQTSSGRPAYSSSPTPIVIASSNDTVVSGTINATIATGSDLTYGVLTPVGSGTTTLTAISHSLGTGTAQFNVAPDRVSVSVTFTPDTVAAGTPADVQVVVSVLGAPVSGANVTLIATLGVLTTVAGVTNSQGAFSTQFTSAAAGPATVSATAFSPLIGSVSATQIIIVTQASSATQAAGGPAASGVLFTLVPVIVIVVVLAVGYFVVRSTLKKRRGKVESYDDPGTEGKS